jgi:hypothetical protein
VKIKFEPAFENADLLYDKPTPAAREIPEWYKKMPLTMDGEPLRLIDGGKGVNATVKACPPFMDSITSGYIFKLPCDIEVSKNDDGGLDFNWLTDIPGLVSSHSPDQVPGVTFTGSTHGGALKWKAGWKIITPRGYSTMFVHPLNRLDLPFQTLSGIVETDTYVVATEFPFILNDESIKDYPFIIEKGTPIIQAIPFKRSNWTSEFLKFDEKLDIANRFRLRSKMFRSYKTQYWKSKRYL